LFSTSRNNSPGTGPGACIGRTLAATTGPPDADADADVAETTGAAVDLLEHPAAAAAARQVKTKAVRRS
jgi:hypothetical protein